MRGIESLITEQELRHAVRQALLSRAAIRPGVRVYEELGVEHGAARIDLALVGDRIEGFELKSDFDSYDRLHNQIHAYNRVFDRITLITGPVFSESAERLMPQWWGISEARRQPNGDLCIEVRRAAMDNPSQDPYSLAMLLWRDEAISILRAANAEPPRRASRAELYECVVRAVPWDRLRTSVAQLLIERESVTT